MKKPTRTTHTLRYADVKDGYVVYECVRGYRSFKERNALAEARHLHEVTGRPVEVLRGQGPYRGVVCCVPNSVSLREKGDDDGREYGDPRDAREERLR